jgi:glutamate N-acetyltransferase/amino-acid N-acetyltransferase
MEPIKFIDGGVCAPSGFKASGVHAGVKANSPVEKLDLALVMADKPCNAAAVFTRNVVKAAPVRLSQKRVADGRLQAIILNSGNANACNSTEDETAMKMSEALSGKSAVHADLIGVASTGVIGQKLNIAAIEAAVPNLIDALGARSSDAADAIMTTDTLRKEFAAGRVIGGKTVRIGGIAKGSGMIHPNMGTLLSVITTDCAISSEMLDKALHSAVRESFNRISVDGDTSTNDSCFILASGEAGNSEITEPGTDYDAFDDMLCTLCAKLAIAMASDGEGAKHLITCIVSSAANEDKAEAIAKSVISSSLFKSAIFGADANWGRVLCAMGYSGENFDPNRVDVTFRSAAGEIAVCKDGRGLPFDEPLAKAILSEHDIEVQIELNEETEPGAFPWCMCWGCDLTYDYVKINGDYRT